LMSAHLTERPKALLDQLSHDDRRDPLARALVPLVMRCLEKDPAARIESAGAILAAIDAASVPTRAGGVPRLAIAVGAIAVLIAAASGVGLWRSQEKARATALLPRIQALAAQGNYLAAYALADRARRYLEQDSVFKAVFAAVSNEITVRSEPAGAQVFVAAYGDSTIPDSSDGTLIGTTPVIRHLVPRADYRLIVRAPGHEPVRRIASRGLNLDDGQTVGARSIPLNLRLPPSGSVPDGMEAIPGGHYEIVGHDIGRGRTAELALFALDRFEVSNDRFAEFIRSGGYRNPALWPAAGGTITPARLVDRTGLPAPRDWVNGEPPAGRGLHPVTGVSWHEAAAYCAWRGNRLPSLFEWEKASRNGRISGTDMLMPWGRYDPQSLGIVRANFSGTGTVPVESYPFAISPYGIYNMAGNVKEWLANRLGDGWGTTGGSWQDPPYLFSQVGSQTPDGSPVIGFRCARTLAPGKGTNGSEPLPVAIVSPTYHPISAAAYPALLEHYRYDRRPANPRGRTVVETSDWIRERMWIDGPKGDSVLLYLYLPRSAEPPFQPLVLIPSSAAFSQSVPEIVEATSAGQIKAGRAIVALVLSGMVEHQGEARVRLPPLSVEFRDRMVWNATEMRLAMDYVSTRADIDSTRFAYFASSWGAGSRLGLAAVDPRFRAVVLLGAGIDERVQPTLPEAANFNFAPYIRAPKLVINGRQDEEHPWLTRGKPLWDLLREPKELLLVDGAGHVVPVEVRTPRINAFLDRTLGPVVPRRR
jgi:hypothetical protein